MEVFSCDVLVLGGGGAGLRAAIAAADSDHGLRVTVISKVYPTRSHTELIAVLCYGTALAGTLLAAGALWTL